MTYRSGYDIPEAVRKVAVATAFRSLFLEDSERPNSNEKRQGLAIAVALFFDLNPFEIEQFKAELDKYLDFRKGTSPFRDPNQYE
jgi:hypothetical protein